MTGNGGLPKGWVRTSLEAVCQVLDSRRIPVNNTERSRRIAGKSEENLYPYYGATGQVGLIDDFIFEGEHILLGEDGAPFLDPFQDKSYLVDGKFWVNNHAHILNSTISNKYVCHYLNQLDYSDHVTGTTRFKLTQNALKRIPVFVAPTAEQRRIVAKIEELFSELDKGVESLKTAQAQLKVYRQAVLKHAFEGKLTEQWREENKDKLEKPEQLLARIKQERAARYEAQLEDWKAAVKGWEAKGKPGKKPAKPKPANDQSSIAKEDRECLLNLPNGWAWIGLAQLFSTSPQNGVYKPASEYGSGTQIIRIDDFYDGQLIRRTGFKKLRLSNEEIEKYKVRNLDLIINRVNSIEFLGKCALVDSLTEDTVFESNIMKCCVIEDVISKSYVAAYLASHEGRNRLCENAKHAVNQASINQTDVGNTLVPITSIEEQLLIVKKTEQKLSQADALIFQIEDHLKKAEALRQSTLKRAFSGQLVAQDPGDEPASFLLDRIKAEKEQTSCKSGKSPKKTRKKRKTAA